MLFILTVLLACSDKADDSSADPTTAVDGGSPSDGGGPSDGGVAGDGGTSCRYDWRGAPCSTEWSGLYNCDECGQAYMCKASTDETPWPWSWAASDVPCACIDLETGAILEHVDGCEGVGK